MPAGRPREYDRDALYLRFETYIRETPIPVIAAFASENEITRELLYDWEEFSTLLKLCTQKKEAALELEALAGNVNCTMAIFSLKQLGWSDRNDVTLKGDKAHPLALTHADGDL